MTLTLTLGSSGCGEDDGPAAASASGDSETGGNAGTQGSPSSGFDPSSPVSTWNPLDPTDRSNPAADPSNPSNPAYGAPPSTPAGSAGNDAPTISGKAPKSVRYDRWYSFRPKAKDLDGDTVTFKIENQPPWATFTPHNGRLRGKPGTRHVGRYSNIKISATDGVSTVSLATFSIEVVGTATGSIAVSWVPPTERVDGSPLHDLAGYTLLWGTDPEDFANSTKIRNPGVATYVIEELTPATYYLVATAFDRRGRESDFSNVATITVE
jgi:hypothetical protein